jgi:error-prone DNA polymerase
VIWPKLYEENRPTILGASMLGVHGRVQREGEGVQLVAYKLFDQSDQLASVGGRDAPLRLRQGRGNEFAHGWSPDARDPAPHEMAARDI